MTEKIFLDKNVLVGSSLKIEYGEKRYEDRFHNESIKIFDLFEESNDVEGWVFSEEVERVKKILENIIDSNFAMSYTRDLIYRKCRQNLEKNMKNLGTIRVERSDYSDFMNDVEDFYRELEEILDKNFMDREQALFELKENGIYYKNAEEIAEKIDDSCYNKLRQKIVDEPATQEDMRLLAKINYLSKQVDSQIYFASTDYHFSPIKNNGMPSDNFISDRIEEFFGIICDWPDALYEELSG